MSVVTSLEETGPCRKKVTIEVPVEAVEAEMGRVVGSFRKKINLPGFRRGKVPVSVVKRRFAEDIRQEVLDRLLPRYWRQAEAEKNLDPLAPPRVEELDLDLDLGKPMTVVASVETRPAIELGDYRDFDLPEEETEPGESEIEEALADLKRQHAEWIPVERAAGHGDMVTGRLTEVTGGEEKPADKPIQVELGAAGVDEGLTLALTDRRAGQTVEHRQEGEEGERDFSIEILAVKEQELPDLDDELASRFGLETADKLTEAVVANLRQGKERGRMMKRERSMLEQLRQRHPFELPAGVIERETDEIIADHLRSQGIDPEQANLDWESLTASVKPEAERRVHDRLLLDAISAAESLRLDESDFERLLSSIAAQQNQSSLALRQQLAENGRLEPLRAQMLRQQTVRFLLGEESTDADSAEDSAADSAAESSADSTENDHPA